MVRRKLANGILCFGPATFVSCAFILSQFSLKGCRFIKLSDEYVEDLSGAVVTQGVMQFAGVYCYELSNGVELLYGNNFDYSPEHLLAQRMALTTTILSAIAWGSYLMAICIKFPSLVWLLVSLLTLVTCITQGIMFKLFDIYQCSDTDCGLSTSSRCGIAAIVFWAISTFMTCGVFKEAQERTNDTSENENEGEE